MKRRSLLVIVALVGCSEEPDLKDTPPVDSGTPVEDAPVDTTPIDTGPSSCPPPGAPIDHPSTLETDETWGAGIHQIKFTVSIRKGATLTLEPCAVVRIAPSHGISVGTSLEAGNLVAKGTAERPVTIERLTTAWASVLVSAKGKADLTYTKLIGGGGTASRGGAMLHLFGDQMLPLQVLAKVSHVTVEGSAKFGVVTEGRGGFDPASDDLVIRGSAMMPALMTAPALGSLPPGTYTGNTTDTIMISGTQAGELLVADTAIHDRGVPYQVGGEGRFGELSVVGVLGTDPTLTIEAGVVLKFLKSGGLFIERASGGEAAKGSLIVKGTADKPVVFTSAEAAPMPGDWRGMWFGGIPSAKNSVDRARIEYAGGNSFTSNASCGTPVSAMSNATVGAILIMGPPTGAFITNTTFLKSAGNGIERGWRGSATSFLPTNTFTEVAFCNETYPKDALGACPMPVPCPR
jgi:hypothetical protein